MLRSRFLFDVLVPSCILFWAAILVYSAVFSNTGYRALAGVEAETTALAEEVDLLRARREALEKRADLLNSKSLDPDLVDERIRSILGYSRDGDVVISREELDRAIALSTRQSR